MDYIYSEIDAEIIDSGEVKFDNVTASVDQYVGTPTVELSCDGKTLNFAFHNLKGVQGVQGPQGIQGPQGPAGPQGVTDWSAITSKPETFTPSAHNHNELYYIKSEVDTKLSTATTNMATVGYVQGYHDSTKQDLITETNKLPYELVSGTPDLSDMATKTEVTAGLALKVDKEEGKGLSHNDLTDTLKANFVEAYELRHTHNNKTLLDQISGITDAINDESNYLTTEKAVFNGLLTKVDKVTGKGLSEEDFTSELKTKLEGIETGAQVNVIESLVSVNDQINLAHNTVTKTVTVTGNVNWNNIQGTTPFYTKEYVDEELEKKQNNITAENKLSFNLISDIPATYTPSAHNHNDLYYIKSEVDSNISSATVGMATVGYVQNYHDATKQDVISDLTDIRSGAALGATAVQPNAISDMATKTWVEGKGYLTEHQSLTPYRTSAQQDVIDNNKVDKVTGKGLSTNDYTTDEKNKLSGIAANAQVNVIEDIAAGSNITVNKSGKTVTISGAAAGVISVNDKTGTVTLTAGDVGAYTKQETGEQCANIARNMISTRINPSDTTPTMPGLTMKTLNYLTMDSTCYEVKAGSSGPETYLKSATVDGATLTIKDKSDNEITFTKPTKTSELTNDSGFLTSHQSLANYYTKDEVQANNTATTATVTLTKLKIGNTNYNIPSGGTGTTDHNQLINRDLDNQHPINAIQGLSSHLSQIPSLATRTTELEDNREYKNKLTIENSDESRHIYNLKQATVAPSTFESDVIYFITE